MSATQDAIKHMHVFRSTAYEAAKVYGIAPSTVYRAIREAAKDKPRCECCGQVLRKDKEQQ